MYKHIALIALLLPFSGYTITKQERRQQIIDEVAKLESQQIYISDLIKYNAWIILISGDSIKSHNKAVLIRAAQLQKEFDQIELELSQEETCSKN